MTIDRVLDIFPWLVVVVIAGGVCLAIQAGCQKSAAEANRPKRPEASEASLVAQFPGGSIYRYDDTEKRATCWVTSVYENHGAISCVQWPKEVATP